MDKNHQYEPMELDDSREDERDLDQIIADRRIAEAKLDAKEVRDTGRKMLQMLNKQEQEPVEMMDVRSGASADHSGMQIYALLRSVICCTIMFSVFIKDRPGKALELFRQMQTESIERNAVTPTVSFCCIYCHCFQEKGSWEDPVLGNILVIMYV